MRLELAMARSLSNSKFNVMAEVRSQMSPRATYQSDNAAPLPDNCVRWMRHQAKFSGRQFRALAPATGQRRGAERGQVLLSGPADESQ